MRKGSSIEFYSFSVPGFNLCRYDNLLTQPISYRNKKEEKIQFSSYSTDGHAVKNFEGQSSTSDKKSRKFLPITNEMLLEKKQRNKNFFFNKKLLIFVPLHKIFSVIPEKISGDDN